MPFFLKISPPMVPERSNHAAYVRADFSSGVADGANASGAAGSEAEQQSLVLLPSS